jgi:hypothetical protein
MMMTSGAAVKYNSSMHCMQEIVKNEGVKSLFKVRRCLACQVSPRFQCQVMIKDGWCRWFGWGSCAAGQHIHKVTLPVVHAYVCHLTAASAQDTNLIMLLVSLVQGAGANILRAVAGAGVLSGYDQLQLIVFGKKFGGGDGG